MISGPQHEKKKKTNQMRAYQYCDEEAPAEPVERRRSALHCCSTGGERSSCDRARTTTLGDRRRPDAGLSRERGAGLRGKLREESELEIEQGAGSLRARRGGVKLF
jgi:hypothetical protein